MKINKVIISIIGCIVLSSSGNIMAANTSSQYPISDEERRLEEMGSLAGSEGLVFRPGKIKSDATKAKGCAVNKYIWQAAIETLNFVPLASADYNGGIIITEWHSPKSKTDFRFKINIFIKDDIIHPDSIQVKIFEQMLQNKQWLENDLTHKSDLAFTIEDKILRKARDLYISAERK